MTSKDSLLNKDFTLVENNDLNNAPQLNSSLSNDIQNFQIQGYAEKYFRTVKKGSL